MKHSGSWEPVIGLEVHAQLQTASKAFCSCSTLFGSAPNSNVCPVCLGMPGTLPVLNRKLVEDILRVGIAVHCRIIPVSVFARKNYFYPDLPKGYQISQFEEPICVDGYLEIDTDDGERKRIRIKRIHMEEDAGKSLHDQDADTLVDLNRTGVPLIEIVTEPDLHSPRDAYHALVAIRHLVTYLGICDGNMEEGSLRCDANVSVRPSGSTVLGTKTEVKNMNSFRHVERALEFEIRRQTELLEDGGRVVQETLLWNADKGVALPMRSKEEAHDYRYFPDPDLVPVRVEPDMEARLRAALPELPTVRRDRFIATLGLPRYDADVLTADKLVADYYEQVLVNLRERSRLALQENAKMASNWVMTDVLRIMGEQKIGPAEIPLPPENLAGLILLIQEGTISGKIAKDVFEEMRVSGDDPGVVVVRKGLMQVSDAGTIGRAIDRVLAEQASQVRKYLDGNEKIFGFFVGEVMKAMKGKANPRILNEMLREALDRLRR